MVSKKELGVLIYRSLKLAKQMHHIGKADTSLLLATLPLL